MSKKGITRCIAVMLIALAFCMTYTPAEAGVSVGGAINPIPTPTNIFTAPGQEVDVIISLTNTSQTTPPDIFQFLPATLTGVTFTIMACADSACTVPLPGTLEFVPVGGNGCVANDPGVTSCSLDLVTDATGNTIAITISGGGVALPPATSGPLNLATVRVRSTAPVSTPGGQFFLRAETGPDDVSATFNSQTATGGMQGSTILVFEAAPCIDVTKECVNPEMCDTTIPFSGVVTNCGNEDLANVTVTDSPSGQVFTIGTLAPGESAPYSGSYTGSVGSNTDTVTAEGTGLISGDTVNATASATCDVICTPCIDVTKECVNPDECDATIPFSGVVTNCGPDVLENVTVTDSPSGQVFTIGTLAPGASAPYSGSYTGSEGSNTDTVTAEGTGLVSGTTVDATASATCDVTCTACIDVTKECTNTVCDLNIPFSGVVTNCGTDVLNNVTVTDSPSGQTFTIGTLAAGASAPFSGTYGGVLGTNTDTVTATGVGDFTQQTVTATATAVCNVSCPPCLNVEKECTNPVECNDTTIPISVTLSNCSELEALANVVVVDDPVVSFTCTPDISVGIPLGGSATCTGSYTGTVGSNVDTVTVTAVGADTGQTVTDTATAECTVEPCPVGACRMTGGHNVFLITADGIPTVQTVEGGAETDVTELVTKKVNGRLQLVPEDIKYTTGGQIGAPQAQGCCDAPPDAKCIEGVCYGGPMNGEECSNNGDCPSSNGRSSDCPWGSWEHNHKHGIVGDFGATRDGESTFSFHSGTGSAPTEAFIQNIICADTGWCVQARCAPTKQIFWEGTGVFHNVKHIDPQSAFGQCVSSGVAKCVEDVCVGGPMNGEECSNNGDCPGGETIHYYRAHVGDFGEPAGNKQKPSPSSECGWTDSSGVSISSCVLADGFEPIDVVGEPPEPFFSKGGDICAECADWYEIEIHCTADPASSIIYKVGNFIGEGNFQIHPEVGSHCEELPE